jgi:hypothetical protein
MRTIIAGSRHLLSRETVFSILNSIRGRDEITEVVCGGAAGVDDSGAIWARKNKIPVKHFHAEWKTFGKKAGPIRNQRMAEYADRLILIWDGKSPGSANMRMQWRKLGKEPMTEVIIK